MAELKFSDRTLVPIAEKMNPIWWFENDDEQTLDQAPWYHPNLPGFLRQCLWQFRNPLQNFRCYVIGVQDRNYSVDVLYGNPDPAVVQRNDVGELGWQISLLKFVSGVRLPWLSYSGKRVVLQFGWQPSGFFGLKFNLHSGDK